MPSIHQAVSYITSSLPLSWQKKEIATEDPLDITSVYMSWMDDFTPVTIEFILDSIQGAPNCKVDVSIGAEQLSQIGPVESCVEFCKQQIREVANRLLQISEPAVLFLEETVTYEDIQGLEQNGEVTVLICPDYEGIELDVKKISDSYVQGAVPVRIQPWNQPKLLLTVRKED